MWHPRFKKEIEQIEKVQRRATKLVPGFSGIQYEDRLQQLDLPSLVYRRCRGDVIEVYKYLNGLNFFSNDGLLPLAPVSALRRHDYKLLTRLCHTGLKLNSFTYRVVNLWNHLPDVVVNASSVNTFKGRLDDYWDNAVTLPIQIVS